MVEHRTKPVQTALYLEGRAAALAGLAYADCKHKGPDKREWQKGFNVGHQKLRNMRKREQEKQQNA